MTATTLDTPFKATQTATPPPLGPVRPAVSDRTPTELVGGAFYADLVRAHYAWERALNDGTDAERVAELGKAYAKGRSSIRTGACACRLPWQ